MVESERAKLGTGVRFSLTALIVRESRAGSLARSAVCKTVCPGSIPGRLSSSRSMFSQLAMSPSLLDGPGSQILNLETRVRIPLGTPGRFADLWPSSGCHASAVEPTNSHSAVLSVPAAGHRATNSIGEVRLLAERPIHQRRVLTRGALPLFSWHETQASEACRPGSIPGRGAAGRDGPIRGSYPRACRFNSCSCIPRRLEASGGSHKAVRGGSNPPVAISFSGCGSTW